MPFSNILMFAIYMLDWAIILSILFILIGIITYFLNGFLIVMLNLDLP